MFNFTALNPWRNPSLPQPGDSSLREDDFVVIEVESKDLSQTNQQHVGQIARPVFAAIGPTSADQAKVIVKETEAAEGRFRSVEVKPIVSLFSRVKIPKGRHLPTKKLKGIQDNLKHSSEEVKSSPNSEERKTEAANSNTKLTIKERGERLNLNPFVLSPSVSKL